jgi:cupin fold WbuC family metalloprotein
MWGNMHTKVINPEVLVADVSIVEVCRRDVELLKVSADENERKRIRLCAHRDIEDQLHEMVIVHTKDAYVRPHKHLNKSESIHIIEGFVDVVLFDEACNIDDVIHMGNYGSGNQFFLRMQVPHYHMLLIRSDILVFHETTSGPFRRSDTIFAPWSPEEADIASRRIFVEQVENSVAGFIE